jgi:hypothetical protein
MCKNNAAQADSPPPNPEFIHTARRQRLFIQIFGMLGAYSICRSWLLILNELILELRAGYFSVSKFMKNLIVLGFRIHISTLYKSRPHGGRSGFCVGFALLQA